MQEQMTLQAGGMSNQDPKAAFKAEWEALEVTEHQWALKNVEQEMLAMVGPEPGSEELYHQNQASNWLVVNSSSSAFINGSLSWELI